MNFHPEGTKLLIKADRTESITKGGIILPETARDQSQYKVTMATVLGIGPDAVCNFNDPMKDLVDGRPVKRPIQIGDRILFTRYGGAYVYTEDRESDLRIIQDQDVLALITDEGQGEICRAE